MTTPPSIIVTRDTTLTQLQKFTEDLKDTKRLRGKQNEDGSITLYAKDSKRGIGSKLFGYSEKSLTKQNMAREAVRLVLTNTERTLGGPPLTNVRKALDDGLVGEMKALSLKLLAAATHHQTGMRDRMDGPGLGDFGGMDPMLFDWANGRIENLDFQSQDSITRLAALAEEFGDQLAEVLKNAPKELLEDLALSGGQRLKNDLRLQLEARLGPDHPALKSESFAEFFDQVFERVKEKVELLPNSMDTNGNVKIGDDVYTHVKHLGQGSFGTVDLYECGKKQIVLKRPQTEEAKQEFAREIMTHRTIHGQGGHDNIVGLIGAVRTDDGIAIALEFAPNGELTNTVGKLFPRPQFDGDPLPPPPLGPEDRQMVGLTLINDLAKGLERMQSTGEGMLHLDFSSHNVFIGEGGVAKIADFGKSTKVSELKLENLPGNYWQIAPELLVEQQPIEDVRLTDEYKSTRDKVKQEFTSKQFDDRDKTQFMESVRLDEYHQANPSTETVGQRLGKKAEVWGLGVMAFELLFGRPPVETGDRYAVRDKYLEFMSDPNNRALNSYDENGVLRPGFFGETTGDPDVDDLVNKLLHPDPNQRPTPEEIVNHPAFRPEVFDSNLGHQLVQGLIDQPQPGGL
jgi:serine/threonine protein kinase